MNIRILAQLDFCSEEYGHLSSLELQLITINDHFMTPFENQV